MNDLHPVVIDKNRRSPTDALVVRYSRFYTCDGWGDDPKPIVTLRLYMARDADLPS